MFDGETVYSLLFFGVTYHSHWFFFVFWFSHGLKKYEIITNKNKQTDIKKPSLELTNVVGLCKCGYSGML